MNVLFTDVMTVYHYRRAADGKDSWQRTVVKGVQWRHSKKELTVSKGIQSEERVESVTVDFSRSYDGPAYVDPVIYSALTAGQRKSFWTLDDKQGLDIMVLGEVAEEITSEEDILRLRERYQYVVTVTGVTDNRNRLLLKHIKVVGK